MLIDQDIVPDHSIHRPSILRPIYRRISPDDIVRLDPGDEITVVIPPVTKNTTDLGGKVLRMYCKMFEHVVERSCLSIHPADRQNVVSDRITSHHFFPRDGLMAMEFPVRVRNYAERHLFASDHPDRPTVTQYWNQGAGINVVICGYTTQLPILLQLKYLAFLEIYMTRHSTCYTNDHITFSHNTTPANLVRPFVEQLKEYNGCRVSTAEIVLKYYRALSASHERLRRIELKKNASDVLTTVDEPDDKVNYEDVLSVIRSELVDDNIESFVGIVDDIYKKSFENQYKDFTVVNDYLVEKKDILEMYQCLVDLFPFIHSVLALTVSHKRYDLVQLSTMLTSRDDANDNSGQTHALQTP